MENKNSFVKFGLIAAVVMIVLNLILYITNMTFETWASWCIVAVGIGIFIVACISFSNANGNNVTFGNIFGFGFKAALIASVVMLVWAIISMFVFPEMKEKAMQHMSDDFARKGISDDIAEKSLAFTSKFWNLFLILGSFLGTLFWGVIGSLLGGAIAKKKPQMPTIMNN